LARKDGRDASPHSSFCLCLKTDANLLFVYGSISLSNELSIYFSLICTSGVFLLLQRYSILTLVYPNNNSSLSPVLKSVCNGSCLATDPTSPERPKRRSINGSVLSDQRILIIRRRIASKTKPNHLLKVIATSLSARRTVP